MPDLCLEKTFVVSSSLWSSFSVSGFTKPIFEKCSNIKTIQNQSRIIVINDDDEWKKEEENRKNTKNNEKFLKVIRMQTFMNFKFLCS